MTESTQSKLLRVRPPRVKITYDVETGDAIEKLELPFIVGILADLSGDRNPATVYPSLKARPMTDIDQDNFNDVMNTLQPGVALNGLQGTSPLLTTLGSHYLSFSNIDDFEPINVINALPGLNDLYFSRSLIRSLQTRAESDDTIGQNMDALIQPGTPQSAFLTANLAFTDASDSNSERVAIRGNLITLQDTLTKNNPADIQTALTSWSLLPVPTTTDTTTPVSTVPPTPAELAAKAAAAAAATTAALAATAAAVAKATLLVQAITAPDTPDNRNEALALLTQLTASTSTIPDTFAALPNPLPVSVQTIVTGITLSSLTASVASAPGDPIWTMPLLLLGLTIKYDPVADKTKNLARDSTLLFVKYLTQGTGTAAAPVNVNNSLTNLFPVIQADTAKMLLAINRFSAVVQKYFNTMSSAEIDAAIKEAQIKGSIAVMDELVALIDADLSSALSTIMHTPNFQKVEATWRGLQYLVFNTETSTMLKLRVFDATKKELLSDMQKAVEFDQSALFKMIYETEYGTYGGFPYSLLIGDYAIGNGGDDIDFLTKMAGVAAAAHAPFIAQASADLFMLSGFDKLDKPRDLSKIFEADELIAWNAFREMEDARYVTLAMPRALLRLPYGSPEKRNTIEADGLNFNEQMSIDAVPDFQADDDDIRYASPDSDHFLWGNPAYLLAERITNAFSLYNWTAAIRGVEGGGLVENLPIYTYTSENGHTQLFCPMEVSITDRREKELNDLGFISLCHCKGTGKAAFFGGQTTNLPKSYFSDDANANAKISAMLPYMLAASRFAHYIKVIMRDKIGSFLTRANVESFLNTWISNYVLLDDNASQEVKSTYPLRSAKIVVTEVPGEPGYYKATVFLKPHFQLEELTTSIRLVANIPK